MMKNGAFFYKHDFGRNKRSRKWVKINQDGLTLKWTSVGANQTAPSGGGDTDRGSPSKGVFRSSSFSRTTSSAQRPARALLRSPARALLRREHVARACARGGLPQRRDRMPPLRRGLRAVAAVMSRASRQLTAAAAGTDRRARAVTIRRRGIVAWGCGATRSARRPQLWRPCSPRAPAVGWAACAVASTRVSSRSRCAVR